jgi:hypothetical protein
MLMVMLMVNVTAIPTVMLMVIQHLTYLRL